MTVRYGNVLVIFLAGIHRRLRPSRKNNSITSSPSCSVLFLFASFLLVPPFFFLIRTISIPQRCSSSLPLSSLFLTHFTPRIPSFPSFAYPSLFVLILHFLERFSFSCKYLSVYSNVVVLPLYLLPITSPFNALPLYKSSICRLSSTANSTSTLMSLTCKITTMGAAPGEDPRWPPRTLSSASSAESRA